MSRLMRVPGTIAEYTVGTLIVLFQIGMAERQERRRSAGKAAQRRR